jgi:hypothetical protein
MNFLRTFMCCLGLVFLLPNICISQDWSRLRPLHSTCDDIKQVLKVATCKPSDNTYDLREERVRITFSNARCDNAWEKLWNVPPGTVLSVERSLKKPIPLKDFHIDENKYEKAFTDFTDETILSSKDEGIEFSVINGKVKRITYTPTPKDDHLLCPNATRSSKKLNTGNFLPWFDRYGDMPFRKEKAHLDSFARELLESGPGAKAHIVVYAGPRQRKGVAKYHATRAKYYLVKKHGIVGEHIRATTGRRGDRLEVELYILPANVIRLKSH